MADGTSSNIGMETDGSSNDADPNRSEEDLGIDMTDGSHKPSDRSGHEKGEEHDYRYKVLETDMISRYMCEIIGEVANLIAVSAF